MRAQASQDPSGSRTSAAPQGPTALRIMLGTQLRRLREASGITAGTAGHAIRASHAKISRMELGRVGCKERDIADLLTLYGVTDERERSSFLGLARRASMPGWWHHYGDVLPSWFETYLGLEQASSVIRTYQPQLIPGLLQTRESARLVIQLGHPNASPTEIERRIALRMARQKFLAEPGAPSLWAVVEEGALWRIGERPAMQEQIRHLIEMVKLPNITLQVVPIYSGAHMAVGGPFTILRFTESDLPDIVYLEQLTSALYLDRKPDVRHYLMLMDRLCVKAQPPAETIKFLNDLLTKI